MVRRREVNQPIDTPKNTLNPASSVMMAKQLVRVTRFTRLSRGEIARLTSGRLVELSPLLNNGSTQI